MLYFLSHQNFQDLCASVWCRLSPHLTSPHPRLHLPATESDCLIPQGTWKVPLQRLTKKTGRQNQKCKPVSTLTLWDKQPTHPQNSPGLPENREQWRGRGSRGQQGDSGPPLLHSVQAGLDGSQKPPAPSLQSSPASVQFIAANSRSLQRGLQHPVHSEMFSGFKVILGT